MRRLGLLAAIATIAGLALGVSPGSGQGDGATVLRYLDVETSGQFVDVDGSGGSQQPTTGDQFIFTDELHEWGTTIYGERVGGVRGILTVISPTTGLISATVIVKARKVRGSPCCRGGTLQVEGVQRFASNAATLSVTGGTGRFAGARGIVKVRSVGGEDSGRSAVVIRLLP